MSEYSNELETMQALFEITEGLLKTAYEGVSVVLQSVVKNNGVLQHGFTVKNPANKSVSPTIYVDNAVSRIINDESDIATEADRIKAVYDSEVDKMAVFINVSDYFKPENFFVNAVNAALNRKVLKDVVHTKKNDLSLVLRCRAGNNASFAVKKEVLSKLHLTASEALDIGISNTISAGFKIEPMEDVLMRLMGVDAKQLAEEDIADEALHLVPPSMYVLTSNDGVSGVSSLFVDPAVRKCVSELFPDKDAIALPSSVYEAIIVDADKSTDKASLLHMVHEVNQTLDAKDVLSESIYYMPKDTLEIQTINAKSLKAGTDLHQAQSHKAAISM